MHPLLSTTTRPYLLPLSVSPVGSVRHGVLHRKTEPNLAGRVSLATDVSQRVPVVLGFQGQLLVPQQARAIQLDNLSWSETKKGDEGGACWGVSLIGQAPHTQVLIRCARRDDRERQVYIALNSQEQDWGAASTNKGGCVGLLGCSLYRPLLSTHLPRSSMCVCARACLCSSHLFW